MSCNFIDNQTGFSLAISTLIRQDFGARAPAGFPGRATIRPYMFASGRRAVSATVRVARVEMMAAATM